MTTNETTPARIIHRQIGHRAFAMMGARDILDCGETLQWKVGRNAKKITCVRVTLAPTDTYTVEFFRGHGLKMKKAAQFEGIYVDSLHALIESNTGLFLSL